MSRTGALHPATWSIVVACRLVMAMIGLYELHSGQGLVFAISGASLALSFLPERLVRDTVLQDATALVLCILLTAHVALGLQGSLYETSTIYDKCMHLLGSGAVAGLIFAATRRHCQRCSINLSLGGTTVFTLACALSAGTLWELFEFSIDHTGLFTAQRGLNDTMLDLAADALGAILVTAICAASVSLCRLKQAF